MAWLRNRYGRGTLIRGDQAPVMKTYWLSWMMGG